MAVMHTTHINTADRHNAAPGEADVPCDLLLDGFVVGLGEQVEQRAAEVVRVAVWVAQLVGDSVQEQVATCTGAMLQCVLICVTKLDSTYLMMQTSID